MMILFPRGLYKQLRLVISDDSTIVVDGEEFGLATDGEFFGSAGCENC